MSKQKNPYICFRKLCFRKTIFLQVLIVFFKMLFTTLRSFQFSLLVSTRLDDTINDKIRRYDLILN